MNSLSPAIFLMGPTAAGKTDLALELVQHFPCDIISVDSAMIYRGMDIGTAKPSPVQLAAAPHRLINILDPAEAYSAAQFRRDALREMAQITQAGRIPLLVGGTMLYFRALQYGLSDLPAADEAVRAQLEDELQRNGLASMHARLAQVDPRAAVRIHPHDTQRIQRALEVYDVSGVSLSDLIDAPQAYGTNRLLRDGAHLIAEPSDVLALLHVDASPVAQPLLSGDDAQLWDALASGAADIATLAHRAGLAPRMAAASVSALEIAGLIRVDHLGHVHSAHAGLRL